MCHSHGLGAFLAILAALSILSASGAGAQPASGIEHRVFIAANNVHGGTGVNFVVDWATTGEIAEPTVEALLFGGVGAGHYAFISQSRPIRIIKN